MITVILGGVWLAADENKNFICGAKNANFKSTFLALSLHIKTADFFFRFFSPLIYNSKSKEKEKAREKICGLGKDGGKARRRRKKFHLWCKLEKGGSEFWKMITVFIF